MTFSLQDQAISRGDAPPQSVCTNATMLAVILGMTVSILVTFWLRPVAYGPAAALLYIAIFAAPVAFAEIVFNKSHLAPGIGMNYARRDISLSRTLRKLVGLWTIFGAIGLSYWLFPVYGQALYAPFFWLVETFWWALLAVSIPYVALVDMHQEDPKDSLWSVGDKILTLRPGALRDERNFLLGWLVKAYFLPLMYSYLSNEIQSLRDFDFDSMRPSQAVYSFLYSGMLFLDLTIAAAGYMFTLRALGTNIRSTEPTLYGWVVTVMCYAPFWTVVYGGYLDYNQDWSWGAWLWDNEPLYIAWAAAIIVLKTLWAWTALTFGIRFSNLTHRGIITNGPYRWTKHPSYVFKNMFWWLIAIPFIPQDGSLLTALRNCALMAGVNLIYYARAITEERHLMKDPTYVAYADYIRRNGMFRFFSRERD
ncbi:isoprenylcysteine carboxylmethyltransferase family protein [Sinirhodobacter sp. HNIBRBA609]|nr:isoprenylcysteine carboxylmethyltransferase family protein [Sinirhodobacter sp. HNIBRBA609]